MKKWFYFGFTLFGLWGCHNSSNYQQEEADLGISWNISKAEMQKMADYDDENSIYYYHIKVPKPDFNDEAIRAEYAAYFRHQSEKLVTLLADYTVKTLPEAENIFHYYQAKLGKQFPKMTPLKPSPKEQRECKYRGDCILQSVSFSADTHSKMTVLSLIKLDYTHTIDYRVSVQYTNPQKN